MRMVFVEYTPTPQHGIDSRGVFSFSHQIAFFCWELGSLFLSSQIEEQLSGKKSELRVYVHLDLS